MSGPVWEEYREAVVGLRQLPAGLRTRGSAIDESGAAAVESARQEARSGSRIAVGWREVADATEREAVQKLGRVGIEVAGPAEARPRSTATEPSPTELTRALRRTMQVMDERLVALESARRVERRRREAAGRDAAARELAGRESAERAAREAAARAARLRLLLLAAVVVAVLLVVAVFVLI